MSVKIVIANYVIGLSLLLLNFESSYSFYNCPTGYVLQQGYCILLSTNTFIQQQQCSVPCPTSTSINAPSCCTPIPPCVQNPCTQVSCPQTPCVQPPCMQTPCPQTPCPQTPCLQPPCPQTPCPQTPCPQTPCPQTPSPPPATTSTSTTTTTTTTTIRTPTAPPSPEFRCPSHTIWNGVSCQSHINVYNVIKNPTNITTHNENKVFVYSSNGKKEISTETSSPAPACCRIFGPRVCTFRTRWICTNRLHSVCGSSCTSPVIYLAPSKVFNETSHLVLPPKLPTTINTSCTQENPCPNDCSGCAGGFGICAPYCYQYDCNDKCMFLQQGKFCESNPTSSHCVRGRTCYEDECI